MIWISLYIIQTLVGAVLWRKYAPKEGCWRLDSGLLALTPSCLVIPNIIGLFIMLGWLIDYFAGIKNKDR